MISAPFCKVSFAQVSITSPVQVKDFLLEQGWVPREFTPKGSPKMTVKNQYQETVPCPSLDEIDTPVGKLLARRGKLKHRVGIIFGIRKRDHKLTGVLNLMRSDGRVESSAMTNATNTGRMAHRNIVNVPKPKDKLWKSGIQLRELFIVPEGKEMMGIDADGLEARVMAHCVLPYKGGEEYAHTILEGDIHEVNSNIFETDRDGAKSPFYCLMYGGQPAKLGETLGCPTGKAKRIFNRFWEESTALSGFKKAITKYWKGTGSKYIKGIDGRRITIRSEHSIVNAYFQSTGSITVKVAALFLDKWCRKRTMSSHQIIIYHDELEYETNIEEKEILSELSSKAFVKAGEYLELRVPITGSPVYGLNWKAVH